MTSPSPRQSFPLRLPPFLGGSLALLAACSGGGGGGGGADPGLDEGSYAPDAFGYADPNPPGFHPLGLDSLIVSPLAEPAIFLNPRNTSAGRVLDDRLAGNAPVADVASWFGAGVITHAAAVGNVDLEGGSELVVGTRSGSGPLVVRIVARGTGGTYGQVESFSVAFEGFPFLALGDVDGDGIDEIVLSTGGGRLRVYDDRAAGWALLLDRNVLSTTLTGPVPIAAADVDGDGRDELALMENALQSSHGALLDDSASGFAPLRFQGPTGGASFGSGTARWVAGDFDGDGRAELASLVSRFDLVRLDITLQRWSWQGGSGLAPAGTSFTLESDFAALFAADPEHDWDAAVLDATGDGNDEVVVAVPVTDDPFGQNRGYRARLVDRNASGSWVAAPEISFGDGWNEGGGVRVCTGDFDSDGAEDALVGILAHGALALRQIVWSPSQVVRTLPSLSDAGAENPLLVAADFDADGMALRSTGVQRLDVGEPIPLVLLTAPPTKAGVAQNHGASSTTWRASSASAETIGVTTTTSYSVSVELSTPLGSIFGVSARGELEASFERSRTATERTTFVQGFTAGFDQDVIVFQGTLYHSYEYRIEQAKDPELIGTLLTFDVPVDSKTYKWSVDKFNAEFGPELALDAELLPHTVGNPASYRSRAALQALVAARVGWIDPGVNTVGATNNGSNSTGIELETASTTSQQRTLTVTGEFGYSAGISSTRFSAGLASSTLYEVEISDVNAYEGVVGDIAGEDWDRWHFDFGLAVYHHGVLANSNNQPLPPASQPKDVRPMQVVTYWVSPLGSSY
jgi:hypothetical protein